MSKIKRESNPTIVLGTTDAGEFSVKLHSIERMLISGSVGSGKTRIVKQILREVMEKTTPQDNIFFGVNSSGLDYFDYDENSFFPMGLVEEEEAYALGLLINNIINERFKLLISDKCPSIEDYNRKKGQNLPHVYFILDDYMDLASYSYALEPFVDKIVQKGYKVGVHIILVSHRLSVTDMSSTIRNNLATRVVTKFMTDPELYKGLGSNIGNLDKKFVCLKENEFLIVDADGLVQKVSQRKIERSEEQDILKKVSLEYSLDENSNEFSKESFEKFKNQLVNNNIAEWTDEKRNYIKPVKKRRYK